MSRRSEELGRPRSVRSAFSIAIGLAVVALLARPAAAAPSDPRRDCLASWRTAFADETRCEDGDPRCDSSETAGCMVELRLCFHQAPADACSPGPVERVAVRTPDSSPAGMASRAAIVDALGALGGTATPDGVAFSPPLADPVCTAPAAVSVPLRQRSGAALAGRRSFTSIATAGRTRDVDRAVLTCLPPVGENAPPLSTGCTAELGAAECAAASGDYGPHGLLGITFCLCRTEDAGQTCTRSRHCQGLCIGDGPDTEQGTCSEHVIEFGCFWLIDVIPFAPPSHLCID